MRYVSTIMSWADIEGESDTTDSRAQPAAISHAAPDLTDDLIVTGIRGARRYWLAPVLALVMTFGWGDVPGADATARPVVLEWSRTRPDTITGVTTHEKAVALSFDDGPDPRYTPAVLDILDRYGVKATFFLEGDHVEQHEALARRIDRAGHEVANHTYDHADLPSLDQAGVAAQIERANDAFRRAGLPQPKLFRPPRGQYDHEAAAAVRAAGLINAGWTHGLCVEKWTRQLPPQWAVDAMLAGVRPGAILLAHDGGEPDRTATVDALPYLLDGLRERGYRVVTVGELVGLRQK